MNRLKRKLAQRLALYRKTDTLPADLQQSLQKHPDLQAEWEQTQRLVALLSIKQYERPDPDVASRCRSSVIRQLRSMNAEESYPVFDWGWDGATPLFRLGLAALFLAFIGLQLMQNPNRPGSSPNQAEIGALTFPPAARIDPRRTSLSPVVADHLDFSAASSSNFMPRVQQGGSHPTFVRFGN